MLSEPFAFQALQGFTSDPSLWHALLCIHLSELRLAQNPDRRLAGPHMARGHPLHARSLLWHCHALALGCPRVPPPQSV